MSKGPDLPEVIELDEMTPENVRAAYIVRFGPTCAAWLCQHFRRKLRTTGSVTMHKHPDQELPTWFELAIAYLEKHRSRRWSVVTRTQRGTKYWRIYWLGKKQSEPLPLSIVPVGRA